MAVKTSYNILTTTTPQSSYTYRWAIPCLCQPRLCS